MNKDRNLLDAQASAMFDSMQQLLENRETPIVESYLQDFYKIDRATVGELFTPGGDYLWLLHPCGTHFGMIGVLPARDTFMRAAIKTYETSYPEERMALYHIKVSNDGAAKISPLTLKQGARLIDDHAPKFEMQGHSLHRLARSAQGIEAASLAQVSVKMSPANQANRSFVAKIDSGGRDLTRLEAMAAAMHAELAATKMSDLFIKCEDRFLNGKPLDEIFPPARIAEVEPGKYAPACMERQRG